MTGGEQGQGHDLGGLDWRDGVIPVSRRFDDPYFSLNDGLAETGHVFLAGNDLPARLHLARALAEHEATVALCDPPREGLELVVELV